MTLQELYDRIGGNYAEAMERLRMDKLISRFILRFQTDTSCPDLFAAWEAHDDEASFAAAHAAKGVTGNLSLTELCRLTTTICEALRPGNDALRASTDIDAYMAKLHVAYDNAMTQIALYDKSQH